MDQSSRFGVFAGMRIFLVAALILAFTIAEADARRRGHRHHRHHPQVYVVPQDGFATMAPAYGDRSGRRSRSRERSANVSAVELPPGWQLQPPDPNWNGKRFVSPDGASWLALYASPAEQGAITAHLKTVAFAEGEEITYLRGERGWIAVSGLKGDRIFYRKAVLACGGKTWRHIAFEYPLDMKRRLDGFVARAADALDGSAVDGCDTISSSQ